LAALSYPDAVKDAQKQLDDIMGDNFPVFDDRPRLPIVEALAKETLRWRPVSAGGIPHAVTQDDEYMVSNPGYNPCVKHALSCIA
jgi:cytochrome P450